jgi:hypothetical protein
MDVNGLYKIVRGLNNRIYGCGLDLCGSRQSTKENCLEDSNKHLGAHIKWQEFPDQKSYNQLHSIGFLCSVQRKFCIGFGLYSAFLFLSVLSTAAIRDVPANAGLLCDKSKVLGAAIREQPCCNKAEWKRTERNAFRLGVHLMGFVQQRDEGVSGRPAEIYNSQCAYSFQIGPEIHNSHCVDCFQIGPEIHNSQCAYSFQIVPEIHNNQCAYSFEIGHVCWLVWAEDEQASVLP